MINYEVWVTVWSEEHKAQIKLFAGSFDRFINAKLCADAYKEHFSPNVEIIEHVKK